MLANASRWKQKNENRYTSFDGTLYLERRPRLSPNWRCRCCHLGDQPSKTTGTAVLHDAQVFANAWYLKLQTKIQNGEPVAERCLNDAFKVFISYHEEDLLKSGTSNARKIRGYRYTWGKIGKFLGSEALSQISSTRLEEFRRWRQKNSDRTLTEKTIHADLSLVRMVLKYAIKRSWLTHLPQFPVERIRHESPDWFTPADWRHLLDTSRCRIEQASETGNASEHIRSERVALHAFVLIMGHGCIRVGECYALRWKDFEPNGSNKKLPWTKRSTLIRIKRGKTGERTGMGTHGVLRALTLLRDEHPSAKPNDLLFNRNHRHGMARLLEAANLRIDAKGRLRNAKTIRHTSIMFRFLNSPSIRTHELSAVSGTSAVVLEKYYLRHVTASMIQDRLTKEALAAT